MSTAAVLETRHPASRQSAFRVHEDQLANSGGGTRTPDPTVNSRLLYQLSYSGRVLRPGV